MTLASPSAGHDPALPADKPKAKLADIHADALALTGLLYVLDQWTPRRDDLKGRGAVVDLISMAERLAEKITNQLEEHV